MNTAIKTQNSAKADFSSILAAAVEISSFSLNETFTTDSTDSFPSETFNKLTQTGILRSVFPTEYGGHGLGTSVSATFELLKLLKIIGYGNLVVGRIFEGHYNAAQLINEYGTREQIERFSKDCVESNHLFGVWNTEAGDGVKFIPSSNGKFKLQGSKIFASGTGFVNRPIITGKMPNGGWQMCVVPLDEFKTDIDPSWWKPMGMRSSRSFRIDLSGVEITENELIGNPNDYYREPFFSGGAIRFAAVQLGAAELLFDLTRKFLQELNRTDDSFQQMRLGEMAIAIEGGNLWISESARIFDQFLEQRSTTKIHRILTYASMMRTEIEQICQDVMIRCERSIGSRGLIFPYHFERVIRDLTTYLRQAAPDAALTSVGRYVLQSESRSIELWGNEND